jgi:hypothetical protein
MTGTLHRHADHFRERNVFAHAALGLLSAGGRFEAFWDGVIEGVPTAARRRTAPPREVFVVLGALRLSRHVRGLLAAFAAEPVPPAPATIPATPRFPVPRRVLR